LFLIWFGISAFWTGDYFIFGIMVTKAVLVAYGVNGADALGFAVVLHVALWLPITLLGAYFMTREGIKWSDSLRMEKEAET
jgi:hypothetical protein